MNKSFSGSSVGLVLKAFLIILCGSAIQVCQAGNQFNAVNSQVFSENNDGINNALKGFWKNKWVCRKSDNQSIVYPYVHYKYYGDDHVLSLAVKYMDEGDENISYTIRYMPYNYVSDSLIQEDNGDLPISIIDEKHFNLTWTDFSPSGKIQFEENWERSFLPSGLARVWVGAYHGMNRKNGKFSGCWQLKGIRKTSEGEIIPVKSPLYYKIYGDGYFFAFIPWQESETKTFISGKAGTFKRLTDNLIDESGIESPIKWLDENTFELKWYDGSKTNFEIWESVKFPSEYSKLVEPYDQCVMTAFEGQKNAKPEAMGQIVEAPDVLPQFPGGMNALMTYLSQNIKYPEACRKANIEGRVMVSFIVTRSGDISACKIVKSPDERLSEEALRVIQAMPSWIPGKVNGESVSTKMTLPVSFKLKNKKSDK